MGDAFDVDDIDVLEARWITLVLAELGPAGRSIGEYAERVDREFRAVGLGRVFSYGTYKNRMLWSIEVEVRECDVDRGIEAARRILRSLDVPESTLIRYEDRDHLVNGD
ncbi:hypothetical protein [Paludisphaera soli]|uniref:hypothetical protein n=1 Tax=Paludisphaera soli TaxID=2712865 RepID=UPI0013EE0165|nr:hypothetical protein [Paludisphaera soli]